MASLQVNEHYSEKTHEEKVVLFLSYCFSQFLETPCNTLGDTAFQMDLLHKSWLIFFSKWVTCYKKCCILNSTYWKYAFMTF